MFGMRNRSKAIDMAVPDPMKLPSDLPVPEDDGASDHLVGMAVPDIALPSTNGGHEAVGIPRPPYLYRVIYAYPRSGQPGQPPLVPEWDSIPGARGCTPESCGFRDHAQAFGALQADIVGLSTQPTNEQLEFVTRLHLPFPVLSDHELRLTNALRLPRFDVAGRTLLKRVTLVVRDQVIEKVFYPVFPPDTHASDVALWLEEQSAGS